MMVSSVRVLVLPGRGNSDPQHWQSLWERAHPSFRRVTQDEWQRPVCAQWLPRLEAAVAAAGAGTVLVAHSLGCLLAAHWSAAARGRVRAALLVGVPDPLRPAFPSEVVGFTPVPMQPLPFVSIVVASTNDPYGSWEHSRDCSAAWGSRLVTIGAAGHINTASGFGEWKEGLVLLESLMQS
jgi:hypothetical protein